MEVAKKIEFIKNWILNYVNSMPTKAESLVIGISGGIDSSVTSTLSAMTGLRTIVLTMPINQEKSQHNLSLKHLEWLKTNFKNVESHTIELNNLFNTFKSSLSKFDWRHMAAIFMALFWLLFHPHLIIKKRRKNKSLKAGKESKIIKNLFKGSVVLEYYILRKKTYREIFTKAES